MDGFMRIKKTAQTGAVKGKQKRLNAFFLTQGDIGCNRQYQDSPFIGGKRPPPIVIKFSHRLFAEASTRKPYFFAIIVAASTLSNQGKSQCLDCN